MGFWQDLTGDTAADASRAAAADTYRKQRSAINDLVNYGNTYADEFKGLSGAYDPYVATGRASNDALARLIADPPSVRSLPGYQFAYDEGIKALDRSASAHSMGQSGRASKDLLRFGTGLADQTYGTQLARLMGLNQQGMAATGAQTGLVGQGLVGQLGTRQSAYGGEMNSAGTIGQGEVAAANAQAAGSQNLLNTGLKLGGMALGAMGGGFGGSNIGYGTGANGWLGNTGYSGWIQR